MTLGTAEGRGRRLALLFALFAVVVAVEVAPASAQEALVRRAS